MTVERKLREGLARHRAGRLEDAALLYREILAENPAHADALNLLGVIFQAAKNWDMATRLGELATERHPDFHAAWVNFGNALQGAGRLDEAVLAFNKALKIQPKDPIAANNAASALNAQHRHGEALKACDLAAENVGDHPDILINRGNALAGLERFDEARMSYVKALEIAPNHALGLFNLGRLLVDIKEYSLAIPYLVNSVNADPTNPQALYSLGLAHQNLDAPDRAERAYAEALKLDPGYVDAINNRAAALQSLNRTSEVLPLFETALGHEPDSPDLHWNLSLALLKTGDYERGFREYEWRWRTPTFIAFARDWPQPRWRGEDLNGKSILVHAEQGFGDQIMFSRFISELLDRGAAVILECRKELVRLFRASFPEVSVTGLNEDTPDTDFQIPLMSLPMVLGTTVDKLPNKVPYLLAPSDRKAPKAVLNAKGPKVGLCWSGSRTRPDNASRSIDIEKLAPLAAFAGLSVVNLQVGPDSDRFAKLDGPATMIDPVAEIADFADTAAIIDALDRVIAVDTGVLHLAGALGKETLGLMSIPTGFFWMERRGDSPWYPTLELARQTQPGDWSAPLNELWATMEDWV